MITTKISERNVQALRLHQFRIEARLRCEDIDARMNWKPGTCFGIEYRYKGRVAQIKKAIAEFVPGERRLR